MLHSCMLLFVFVKSKSKDFFQLQFFDEYDRFPPHIDSGIQYKVRCILSLGHGQYFSETENTFYLSEQRYCKRSLSERTFSLCEQRA